MSVCHVNGWCYEEYVAVHVAEGLGQLVRTHPVHVSEVTLHDRTDDTVSRGGPPEEHLLYDCLDDTVRVLRPADR